MRASKRIRTAIVRMAGGLGLLWLGGCNGAPPPARPPAAAAPEKTTAPPAASQPPPKETPNKPMNTAPPSAGADAPSTTAAAPSSTPPPPPPADTPPAAPPTATKPAVPEYLTVLERFQPNKSFQVSARADASNSLILDTDNIQRLKIDRKLVPLKRDRSIAIFIDKQGIEWTPKSETVILERSANGVWKPAKP